MNAAKLNIIAGRAGSGKTSRLIEMMRPTENAIYIVPEQYSFAAEKRITHAFGISGMGSPVVLSFRRLGHYVENLVGKSDKDAISPSGKVMVMQSITKKKADSLSLFGGAAKRGDMASLSASTITTFKQYGVKREQIAQAAEKTKNPILKKKLLDCALIYDEYSALLEKGYRDSEDALEILKRNIEESAVLCNRDIFIDSFIDFTPLEYEVIEALLLKAKSVTVSLTTTLSPDAPDEFVTANNAFSRLTALAAKTNARFDKPEILQGAMYTASDEMKITEASFFDETIKFTRETGKVRLYKANNEYSEAHAAAREVERLCRDEGFRYRDIVIVARDLSTYERALEKAFAEFSIPLFIDKKTPLSKEPAAQFVMSAINIIQSGRKNDSMFAYMKTAFSPLDRIEADELENYCLEAGVTRGDWYREDDWKMPPSLLNEDADEEYINNINSLRRRLLAPLEDLEKSLSGRKSGGEIARAFYEFMQSCNLEKKITEISEKMQQRGETAAALRQNQVYELLLESLESFEGAFRDEKLSAEEFCSVFFAGLESVEIGVIPAVTDTVCAGSIDRARGHGAECVLIIGAAEGVFPSTVKESGIFSDADKAELAQYGIELPPGVVGQRYMEQSLVYGALTCARKALYVSYPAVSDSEARTPSIIMRRLHSVFPNAVKIDETTSPDAASIGSAQSTYELFVPKFAEMQSGNEVEPEWYSVLDFYEHHPDWQSKTAEIKKYTGFENKSEQIKAELIRARYGDTLKTSVSSLEKFSACPFSYFATVTLNLRERRELEMTAANSGTFLHDFVDLFGKSLADDGKTWKTADEEYIDRKTEEITLELLSGINRHLLETSAKSRRIFVNLKRIAKKSVTILSNHMKKGLFEPLGYEIEFNNGKFKPLRLTLPTGQKVSLRGRIDRTDILKCAKGEFVRIIDYKSGKKSFSLSGIYQGFDLQLAAYLTTICENGGYKPAGVLYFRIDDPIIDAPSDTTIEQSLKKSAETLKMDGLVLADDDILYAMDKDYAQGSDVINVKRNANGSLSARSQVADAKSFAAMSSHVKKMIKQLCGEILSGKTDISPTRDACTYCAVSEVCAFDSSLKGCNYRKKEKLSDTDALLKMIQEERTTE
ncbi:MAG: PD-(D/E)XK nuclease family protein [Clostridia bacterium]|nr:PD-(D/E)XK nuclease family protein [Clostridia bacterium]